MFLNKARKTKSHANEVVFGLVEMPQGGTDLNQIALHRAANTPNA
jgi:hypothetical protein